MYNLANLNDYEFENLLEEDLLDIENFLDSYVVKKVDEEKIDYEKIISEMLNKSPNIENTNQKLFLDENNIF